jgi:hypothetical protein
MAAGKKTSKAAAASTGVKKDAAKTTAGKKKQTTAEALADISDKISKFGDSLSGRIDVLTTAVKELTSALYNAVPTVSPQCQILQKHTLKFFDPTAAAAGATHGGTWTLLKFGTDSRVFAATCLHCTECYKGRDGASVIIEVPAPIAKHAVSVGLYAQALATVNEHGAVPDEMDVVLIEVDAAGVAHLKKHCDAVPLVLLPAAFADVAADVAVVGWSERMPLSGRVRGRNGNLAYITQVEGCVAGNSGALMTTTTSASAKVLGLYIGTENERRSTVVRIPKVPSNATPALAPSSGASPKFQLFTVGIRDTTEVIVSTSQQEELSLTDSVGRSWRALGTANILRLPASKAFLRSFKFCSRAGATVKDSKTQRAWLSHAGKHVAAPRACRR